MVMLAGVILHSLNTAWAVARAIGDPTEFKITVAVFTMLTWVLMAEWVLRSRRWREDD